MPTNKLKKCFSSFFKSCRLWPKEKRHPSHHIGVSFLTSSTEGLESSYIHPTHFFRFFESQGLSLCLPLSYPNPQRLAQRPSHYRGSIMFADERNLSNFTKRAHVCAISWNILDGGHRNYPYQHFSSDFLASWVPQDSTWQNNSMNR